MARLLPLLMLFVSGLHGQIPAVFEGGVGNAASAIGQPIVTPGSLVSIFGSELAAGLAQADTIPLATSLTDVTVFFNNIPAPLLFVSQGQINAQLPWDVLGGAPDGMATVVVQRGGAMSAPIQFPVGPFSPGIFTFPPGGIGQAIAVNPDGSVSQPVGSIPGIITHPADIGTTILVYATGLGAVDPPIASGVNALDATRFTVTEPTVTLGGVESTVGFSGLAPEFVGVNQLNLTVAGGTPVGDEVPIHVSLGGVTSPDGATIAVR